jgi:hypothetical protein
MHSMSGLGLANMIPRAVALCFVDHVSQVLEAFIKEDESNSFIAKIIVDDLDGAIAKLPEVKTRLRPCHDAALSTVIRIGDSL